MSDTDRAREFYTDVMAAYAAAEAEVPTGDEAADVQLAADQAKQKLEDAAAEIERITAKLTEAHTRIGKEHDALTAAQERIAELEEKCTVNLQTT